MSYDDDCWEEGQGIYHTQRLHGLACLQLRDKLSFVDPLILILHFSSDPASSSCPSLAQWSFQGGGWQSEECS